MRKDNFPKNDYKSEMIVTGGRKLILPKPKFAEMRLPKLSLCTVISAEDKEMLESEADSFTFYGTPAAKALRFSVPSFVYVAGEDYEVRGNVAACLVNYVSDKFEHRNSIAPERAIDLVVMHIDAEQTFDEEIPTEIDNGEGRIEKLVPLDFPFAQRVNYLKKVCAASQEAREHPENAYVLLLPDLDKILSQGPGEGWTNDGRSILGEFETLQGNAGNCMVVGTLDPDPRILYGDGRQAGLNKTHNIVIKV